MPYVIVGNGVAGMEAALARRGRDDEARISIVSAEHDHFFSRMLQGRVASTPRSRPTCGTLASADRGECPCVGLDTPRGNHLRAGIGFASSRSRS
jgi:hypothetical protein